MRRGLNPLPIYIAMAAAAWPKEMPSDFSFDGAMPPELPEELRKMLLGIQSYHKFDGAPDRLPLDEIWRAGTMSVHAVPEHEYISNQPAIILIPSMINKGYVLDLMEGRSMLRWFGAQGFNPYLLDWGAVSEDAGQRDMDGAVMDRIIPALEFLNKRHGDAVHALGYCMGGTVLLGAATRAQKHLKSITMLAAPWDFHAGSQALLNRVKFFAPSAFPVIEEKGVLSVDWIQTLFASLDPAMTAKKFSKFEDMDKTSNAAKIFVAVEDWLNDGVELPAAIAQHCITDWFLKNQTYAGQWKINGEFVHPEMIDIPTLIVASKKDRLVEYECAAALQERIAHADIINPECGHIGMIAGGVSVEKVWAPVAKWIRSHDK